MTKFHRERFFNEPGECFLLRTVQGLHDAPPFASYVTYGDDLFQPLRLDLYRSARPAHNEQHVAIYDRVGQVLKLRTDE